MFEGPGMHRPGAYRGVAIDLAAAGLAHPFDVRWMPDADGGELWGLLAVTTHTAGKSRSGQQNMSRLTFFSTDGRLLRSVTSELFNEPNMMAVQ